MNTKQKILEALDCALDEIGEERLLDILLDAYKAKKAEIARINADHQETRRELHDERERWREERHRMLTDPSYSAAGQYFFLVNHHKICLTIQGRGIQMFERVDGIDYMALQMGPTQWHSEFTK